MLEMTVSKWKELSQQEKKQWLDTQPKAHLFAFLGMVHDLLFDIDQMDDTLVQLIEPSDQVINTRNTTVNTLRDMEHLLKERVAPLERTV